MADNVSRLIYRERERVFAFCENQIIVTTKPTAPDVFSVIVEMPGTAWEVRIDFKDVDGKMRIESVLDTFQESKAYLLKLKEQLSKGKVSQEFFASQKKNLGYEDTDL